MNKVGGTNEELCLSCCVPARTGAVQGFATNTKFIQVNRTKFEVIEHSGTTKKTVHTSEEAVQLLKKNPWKSGHKGQRTLCCRHRRAPGRMTSMGGGG